MHRLSKSFTFNIFLAKEVEEITRRSDGVSTGRLTIREDFFIVSFCLKRHFKIRNKIINSLRRVRTADRTEEQQLSSKCNQQPGRTTSSSERQQQCVPADCTPRIECTYHK